MAYVRNLRLCRVRHDLLDPAHADDSVSSAARRWSFTHMGQFSHDYRALFGEMPSKTLAAARSAVRAKTSQQRAARLRSDQRPRPRALVRAACVDPDARRASVADGLSRNTRL